MRHTVFVAGMIWALAACQVQLARASQLTLFWNSRGGIQRWVPESGALPQPLFGTFDNRGLAADPAGRRLVWSDNLPLAGPLPGGFVRTGLLRDGSIDNVASFQPAPAAVAFDAPRGRVYWSDTGGGFSSGAIFSANLDGSDRRPLVSEPWVTQVAGLALDAAARQLYFSYQNPLIDGLLTGGIARLSLEDGKLEPLVGGLAQPTGVAVAPGKDGGLFWGEAGFENAPGFAPASDGSVQAADLDGQNVHTILAGLADPYAVALDPGKGLVYWSDAGTGKIQRTVMSGILPYFEDVVTGLAGLTSLALAWTPRLGDADGDDAVGAADYALWAAQFGQTGDYLTADFDGNGQIGAGDYAVWAACLTASGETPLEATSVPEPASGWLLLAGLALVAAGRYQRRGRSH